MSYTLSALPNPNSPGQPAQTSGSVPSLSSIQQGSSSQTVSPSIPSTNSSFSDLWNQILANVPGGQTGGLTQQASSAPQTSNSIQDSITQIANAVSGFPALLASDSEAAIKFLLTNLLFLILFIIAVYVVLTGQTDIGKVIEDSNDKIGKAVLASQG